VDICKRVQIIVSPSHTTKLYKFIKMFGVKEIHVSVTLHHIRALCIGPCDLQQVVLGSGYKDGNKHIDIVLKVSVL
jgi:hypothetical protein